MHGGRTTGEGELTIQSRCLKKVAEYQCFSSEIKPRLTVVIFVRARLIPSGTAKKVEQRQSSSKTIHGDPNSVCTHL